MRYTAKVTSKGQITIPAEVRRALELEPGASVAFEVNGDEAHIARARSIVEISAELREKYHLRKPEGVDEDAPFRAAFRKHWEEKEKRQGDTLWLLSGGRPPRRVSGDRE